jgi:hypothetical protein
MKNKHLTLSLKFPFQFNIEHLKKELAVILKTNWVPHFNKDGYMGEWNSIALYAVDGDASNILAHNNAALQETPMLKNSPYIKEVIGHFKCPILSARLLKLGKGAFIKPHRDYELGYEDGNFRVHVPIITNPDVDFILDGEKLDMQEGQCWYTNVNYVHAVANRGQSDRVHLVVDYQRNDWSDRLFFSMAPKESFFPKQEQDYPPEVMNQMIQELKQIDTEGARNTILELQKKINGSKI